MHPWPALILSDGTTALVRSAEPADAAALGAFIQRMRVEGGENPLVERVGRGRSLAGLCDSSQPARAHCLLALRAVEGERRVVGAAGYSVQESGRAEVALGVDPAFRGRGLATGLVEQLAFVAAHHGVRVLTAARHGNAPLLDVLRHAGLPRTDEPGDAVRFDLSAVPDAQARERSEMRDRLAATASLRPFFRPAAVAVVGASRDPKGLGARTLHALVANRFEGPVYAVNPHATSVGSFPAYPSVSALPGPVDLALVLVPAPRVPEVVEDCAAAGVRALVVISAGFAETGEAGRARQEALLRQVRGHGMRMVGPNCMGLLNADPGVRLNASFSPVFPPAGNVAMSSQSGALGLAVLATAEQLGIGLSSFVSVGNKADISGNDLLQYWEQDPRTDVILLYVESFGNPQRFARIARRVGRRKPIVAVKSGRTGAGRRAAGSHTAALAGSDAPVDALFRQTGVIRADTLEEMFDLALFLSSQPLPGGRRVAILTNAGGPGILCADACVAQGMEIPEPASATREELRALLPPEASVSNPIDMIASAGPEQYRRAAEVLLADPQIDVLIVIFAPIDARDLTPVEDALEPFLAGDKPVITCLMGEGGRGPARSLRRGAPSYVFPEAAARVLGKIADYATWRDHPPGSIPELAGLDVSTARAVCRDAIEAQGPGWLLPAQAHAVLQAMGIPVAPGAAATCASAAAQAAEQLGYPVALKLASRSVVHKTDVGGVALDLPDGEAVEKAFAAMQARAGAAMEGVWVQPMVRGGVEVMAGLAHDPEFGPVLAFGLGGVFVELLGDVVFRVTPITDVDAREMVRGVRGHGLLAGHRGRPPADEAALEELLLRLSRLAREVPEIDELDLNPVFAFEPGRGLCVVDARIHVRPAPA